ncbi:caspase-1-like isoform X2 [Monodelphis domestica]|uniref:caspase-1-like isoform X2 n=1 Tax=Monodelphis domestica TaxID=13616 RepID=UPI00044357D6|nr:caspase-1-like isoform X2 [Monodelphis domestica]
MADQDLKEKRKLFVQFVNKGTINCLLDDLLQANVFNQEEFEQIQKENDTSMDKARVLIDYVIRKGPKASEILIKSIWNRDPHLGHNLKLPYSASTAQTGSSGKLKVCSREEFLMQRRLRVEEIYPVMEKGSRTRLALIICNKKFENISERHGAEIDTIGMKTLLEDLDYNVYVKENLTSLEMESALKEFASHPDHQLSDSTFVVLMSHGVRHGICGIKHKNEDPDVFLYETMYEILNTRNCPNLKDKPKIIIVQACRGDNYGEVWVNDSSASCADSPKELQVFDHDAVSRAHSEKDFIAFHSSTPNNVSWRHPRNGSVFITKLIHYFQQYCWCYHIEEIFRKVQNAFETPEYKFQMPTIERLSMTRYFYLFPGN